MAKSEIAYRTVVGDQQTISVGYLVSEAYDASDAIAQVRNDSPIEYGTRDELGNNYFRANVDVVEVEIIDAAAPINTFRCTVRYEYRYRCPLLTYDFSGVTVRITQSLATVGAYTASAGAADTRDFDGAIEVSETGDVQGADAIRPGGEMVLLWHPPQELVVEDGQPAIKLEWDSKYFKTINNIVGAINVLADGQDFYGYGPFEVLLTGITTNYLTHERQWEIEFRFKVGDTKTWGTGGLVPGIEGGEAKPHDVLWFLRKKGKGTRTTGGDYQAPKVMQINVERVAKQLDFDDLFIPSNTYGDDDTAIWGLKGCPSPPHFPNPIPDPPTDS